MQFILNMIGDESFVAQATPEQMQEIVAAMDTYNQSLKDAGAFVSGEGLGPSASARTLRFGEDGKAVPTDGPFAETKEQVAGFWIIEAKDLDEAADWAAKAPIKGASIEIRPIASGAEENFKAYKEAERS
jgi:hypothetical protein